MLRRDDGVGLAAPQVGVNVRVMVFNPTGRRGEEEVTLVNPRLVSEGKARELGQEGCLSFPQVFAPVEVRRTLGDARVSLGAVLAGHAM